MSTRRILAGVFLLSFILMARYQVLFFQSLEWTRMFVVNLQKYSPQTALTETILQTHSCQICKNIWSVVGENSKILTKVKARILSFEPFFFAQTQIFLLKIIFPINTTKIKISDLFQGSVFLPPPEPASIF
jgi:hypothetical protein